MSKNTRNRILLTALAALLLVTLTIGGTVAWLTDKTTEVQNTFTPSEVDIVLTETTGNSYKMIPGDTIIKDPKVTVIAGSEASWVFVKIEEKNNFNKFFDTYTLDGWTALGTDYPGVYYRAVAATSENTSFNVIKDSKLVVKSGITNQDMAALTETTYPQLVITAYAVQQLGFENNPTGAWAQAIAEANQIYGEIALPTPPATPAE